MSIVGGAGGTECCQAMEACVVTTSLLREREGRRKGLVFVQGKKGARQKVNKKEERDRKRERERE